MDGRVDYKSTAINELEQRRIALIGMVVVNVSVRRTGQRTKILAENAVETDGALWNGIKISRRYRGEAGWMLALKISLTLDTLAIKPSVPPPAQHDRQLLRQW